MEGKVAKIAKAANIFVISPSRPVLSERPPTESFASGINTQAIINASAP
jgi:hypothetical protein